MGCRAWRRAPSGAGRSRRALGNGDGESRTDDRAVARRQHGPLARREVQPGVAGVRAPRHHRVGRSRWIASRIRRSPVPGRTRRSTIWSEPGQVAPREAGDDQHALSRVGAVLDGRPERVELREPPALRYGTSIRTASSDPRSSGHAAISSAIPSPRLGRDLKRIGETVRETPPADLVDPVDLVQHDSIGSSPAPISSGRRRRPDTGGPARRRKRRVDHVEHHVRHQRLFEGRREALDQLVRAGGG